jgi:hypothetical protein
VAEFFEEAAGAPGADKDAADLCRLLLVSIDPKEPRIRPQLQLVSSTDDHTFDVDAQMIGNEGADILGSKVFFRSDCSSIRSRATDGHDEPPIR